MNQQEQEFKQWCIVELFGHSQNAGIVSSQQIGGEVFIRIDVPECEKHSAYTKFYGKGAIYSITPVTEEIARRFLGNIYQPPVEPYMLKSHEENNKEIPFNG